MQELYACSHHQIPFFIARYWPDSWAFRLKAVNDAAIETLIRIDGRLLHSDLPEWLDLTEQQYVRKLYLMRKDALTLGDQRTIERLNRSLPPRELAGVS